MIGSAGGWREIRPTAEIAPILAHVLAEARRELSARPRSSRDESVAMSALTAAADRAGFELNSFERDRLLSEISLDERPFGILQGLVEDPAVTDIIVSGYSNISVQEGRKNYRTDLSFSDAAAYSNFVERLVHEAGSRLSTKQPIADGMLGPSVRLHAVHESISEGGPYLTLRLSRFDRVELRDLVSNGMAPAQVLAYLAAALRTGRTLLIVGEVGCGKTTLLRALAAGVPSDEAILVIEDTPEIRIAHPHVRYIRTRESNAEGAGHISPAQCIRGGMRMAMNRIIFGEIRDAQAAEAFVDVCASGHPGISTMHARSASEAVTRLELFLGRAQRGAAKSVLSEQIAAAVEVIVFLDVCRTTGRRVVAHVREIGPVADGALRFRDMFRYEVVEGVPAWRLTNRVSAFREALETGPNGLRLSDLPALLGPMSAPVRGGAAW